MERLEPVLVEEQPGPGDRPRRRQLDPGGGADRGQDGDPGRPRRVRPAQLRPARCPRRSTGSSPTSFSELLFLHSEEAIDEPARRGHRRRAHALRRQHDDRHPGRARRPLPRRRARPRGSASSPAPTRSSPCTAPPWSTGRCCRETVAQLAALAARDAGRLPGPPAHPQDDGERRAPSTPGLLLTEPLGYLDFLSLLADAGAVLTDSGGIQEETTYLGVPCFTLRDNTERPVTVRAGTNTLLGLDPAAIADDPGGARRARRRAPPEPPPLWDGHAAERIADVSSPSASA